MKKKYSLLATGLFFGLALISYQTTHALFTHSTTSSGNVFTAGSISASPPPPPPPAPAPSPAPPPPPAGPQAGDVVINEINWAGSSKSTADEWVELKNMTGNVIDLSNWVVVNLGDSATPDIIIPLGKSISANGFFIISNFSDTSTSSNLNVVPDLVTTAVGLLNNSSSEQLILKTASPSGITVDTTNHNGGNWFAGTSTAPQKSMERNTIPADGTLIGNWHTATSSANLDSGAVELATPKTQND